MPDSINPYDPLAIYPPSAPPTKITTNNKILEHIASSKMKVTTLIEQGALHSQIVEASLEQNMRFKRILTYLLIENDALHLKKATKHEEINALHEKNWEVTQNIAFREGKNISKVKTVPHILDITNTVASDLKENFRAAQLKNKADNFQEIRKLKALYNNLEDLANDLEKYLSSDVSLKNSTYELEQQLELMTENQLLANKIEWVLPKIEELIKLIETLNTQHEDLTKENKKLEQLLKNTQPSKATKNPEHTESEWLGATKTITKNTVSALSNVGTVACDVATTLEDATLTGFRYVKRTITGASALFYNIPDKPPSVPSFSFKNYQP